tara:strand:- start:626 stop:1084 length:459 start_codon:yes stop_codon:yes gene_type:complete
MSDDSKQVVDFNEVRTERLDQKRRKTQRILFKQMMGIYSVSEGKDLRSIEILDVSEDGLSFQVPFNAKDPWPADEKEVVLRLYFSQETYLPIHVEIKNSRPSIQEGIRYVQYGCTVDKHVSSYKTFNQFVGFLKSYSENAHQDTGGVSVFYL